MSHNVDIDVPGVRIRVDGEGVDVRVRQSDLTELAAEGRLEPPVLVVRVERRRRGGGFGDPESNPYAWSVFVRVDGRLGRLTSARGGAREWTSLDRLEPWLREQGVTQWLVVNELEATAGR